jgi:hypothetical protein
MINDYGLIETIKNWIDKNRIEGHLFLFSASSLSKMAIHQLYEHSDRNTYIDVGTTLNPFMHAIGQNVFEVFLARRDRF